MVVTPPGFFDRSNQKVGLGNDSAYAAAYDASSPPTAAPLQQLAPRVVAAALSPCRRRRSTRRARDAAPRALSTTKTKGGCARNMQLLDVGSDTESSDAKASVVIGRVGRGGYGRQWNEGAGYGRRLNEGAGYRARRIGCV